jgi:hypothetical protein
MRMSAAVAACVVLFSVAVALDSGAAPANKVEVRRVEVGHVLGRPGLRVRLTLLSGQAVEYRTEDAVESAQALQMADVFFAGHARLFAELDGTTVVAVALDSGDVHAAR